MAAVVNAECMNLKGGIVNLVPISGQAKLAVHSVANTTKLFIIF